VLRVLSVGNAYPPHHLGGYEVIAHGVTEELLHQDAEVRVLTTDHLNTSVSSPELTADIHRELRWYWHNHMWPEMSGSMRLSLERHNARAFERHLREFKPNVIAWWAVGGMSLSLLERARRAGIPSVLFILDYWPDYGLQHDQWLRMWRHRATLGRLAERLTGIPTTLDLDHAGRWLFCSQTMADATLAMGIQPTDSGLLPPGVDGDFLAGGLTGPPAQWSGKLLYLGRVVEQKGVLTAVEALAQLPDMTTLKIVGDGDARYRKALADRAAELGVAERVQFAPAVSHQQTIDEYRAADALIFPVQWPEPFGLVPLEAMALGTPVLATGTGGSGDYLEDGENCLLFKPGEATDLASAVTRLAADPALRERLRDGGRRSAASHSAEAFNRAAADELRAAAGSAASPSDVAAAVPARRRSRSQSSG
jgi:glycosyltransferase involved in cell wall biosynthesis